MARKSKTPRIFYGIPILHARKKGKNVPGETEKRNVTRKRIYKIYDKEDYPDVDIVESATMNDPKPIHAEHVNRRARGVPRPHEFRYICYISGCPWSVNNGASEARSHFAGGYHNEEIYDVKQVIQAKWNDWLDDEDLEISSKATSQEDWDEMVNEKKSGIKEEEVEEEGDEEMDVDHAEADEMDLEPGDVKQEED